MPRPEMSLAPPCGGAAEPPRRDVEALLQLLASEFERVLQENSKLDRELVKLRGSSKSTSKCFEELEGEDPAGFLLRQASPQAESAQGSLPVSAWRRSTEAEAAEAESPKKLVEKHSTKQEPWRASVETQPKKSSLSSKQQFSNKSTKTVKALSELFQYMDVHGTGKFGFEDVVEMLRKHKEPFEYGGLVNVVRVFNHLEPLDFQAEDADAEALKSEALGLDFPAFVRIMDGAGSWRNLDEASVSCVEGFQRACKKEAVLHTSIGNLGSKESTFFKKKEKKEEEPEQLFWLEVVPTFVILLNMLLTGASIDYEQYAAAWDICEGIFVAFYLVELVIKMRLYGCKGFFFGSQKWWNWFDFLCLQISLVDTFIKLGIALLWPSESKNTVKGFLLTKVFRLARLARLVRTLRFKIFYELKLMVLGIFSGFRVLGWAVVLLVFLAYPMGVAMTSTLGEETEFDSVINSMFTLFRCWTDGCSALDGTPLSERLYRQHGIFFMGGHILMTMFVTIGLFNLIMAIYIDNVVNTQALRKAKEMAERSTEIEQRFKKLFAGFVHDGATEKKKTWLERLARFLSEIREREVGMRKTMQRAISNEWESLRSTNVSISKEMFAQWLEHEDFKELLDQADIDFTSHSELFDVLDVDMGGELSMDELTTGLMKLRGPVSKTDIVAVRLKVNHLTEILEQVLHRRLTKSSTFSA